MKKYCITALTILIPCNQYALGLSSKILTMYGTKVTIPTRFSVHPSAKKSEDGFNIPLRTLPPETEEDDKESKGSSSGLILLPKTLEELEELGESSGKESLKLIVFLGGNTIELGLEFRLGI
ncbi:MAG: hypothetical protein Q8T08_07715 [Ignavibacteria bacterium]|nr:hypothetical protein [Ignavibacteria bacterium]